MVNPTIFISIPKRWVQLYEMLEEQLNLDSDESDIIQKKIKSITGGKLNWGLSAAGYLDPDIFKGTFPQDATVPHTIQGDSTGQNQIRLVGLLVNMADHLEEDFFTDFLDRGGNIHFSLTEI